MNVTVLDLIQYVFEIAQGNVVGQLQDWVRSKRFNIVARTTGAPATRSRLKAMVKALLEDRFRLNASLEQATRPAYVLAMARSDGSTGPNLRQAAESKCQGDPTLIAQQTAKTLVSVGCGLRHATNSGALIAIMGSRVTMDQFAAYLSIHGGFDRPVVNRTALNGEFDFTVIPPKDMPDPSSEARFLTALREQLGLGIRAEQASVEILRIHRIEPPSGD